jgi:thiamine-monophosphate kinase
LPRPERQLIERIRRPTRPAKFIVVGIGDDCAVLRLPRGHEALVTTDFSLEGIHFRRDWQSPECIGHRCLARGLSDIAAMGGRPIAAFLSLALPTALRQNWVDRFLDGFLDLAREFNVGLAGGDTAQSPTGVLADVMVVGSLPRGSALLRSGAGPGDQIYVTGELGQSAAALRDFTSGKIKKRDVYPAPRIAVGEWLRANRVATAAIDVSDGLSTDLSHICKASRVGAVIESNALPINAEASKSRKSGPSALDLALNGGEDYELLFTAPKSKRVPGKIAGVEVTRIGEIVRGRSMQIVINGRKQRLEVRGWEHFGQGGKNQVFGVDQYS